MMLIGTNWIDGSFSGKTKKRLLLLMSLLKVSEWDWSTNVLSKARADDSKQSPDVSFSHQCLI